MFPDWFSLREKPLINEGVTNQGEKSVFTNYEL